jgi:hypothetical protein
MKSLMVLVTMSALALVTVPSVAADDPPWPQATFEIFRLAPGRHEDFIRTLALWDQVSAAGGQPPTQMFIHQEGDDWDVLLFKPFPKTPITPAQQAAMDAKADQLHLKTGPAFFLEIRENVASHTETTTLGPLSAAQWLARLDAWRTAHPEATKRNSQ